MTVSDAYVRDRNAELNRRVRALEAERRQLEQLLAMTLRVASHDGEACDPLVLLELVAASCGIYDLARPAWVREARARERRRDPVDVDSLVELLRRTDPDVMTEAERAA